MSPVPAAFIGVAAALVVKRRRLVVGSALWLMLTQPLLLAAGAVAVASGRRWRSLRAARRRRRHHSDDVVLFAELVSLGLGSGLPFLAAADVAASSVPSDIGAEARSVLRRARMSGAAATLAVDDGELAPLFRLASRALATGAPLVPAIAGFVAESRKERAAEQAAASRRLPVRLLLPLTLLILPGFIVLTLGPAVLSGLDRLVKGSP